MSDVLTPEQKLYSHLGSIADSIKENNFFQAEEDVAALKKFLKGQSSEAAREIQKRFPDLAHVVKQGRKEPALQEVRTAMTIVERWLP
ncbi:MAG: hypothetical protein ACLPTQ_19960 [Terriglobales bacterium]